MTTVRVPSGLPPRVRARDVLTETSRLRVQWDRHLRPLFIHLEDLSPRDAPSKAEAAHIAHCSEATLQRRLARAGISWRSFVASWRLREAASIRRAEDVPLKVIAPAVGYASASTLSRALWRGGGTDAQP